MKNRRIITRINCELMRRVSDVERRSIVEEHRHEMRGLDLFRARSIVQADYIIELEKEICTLKLKRRYNVG